MTEPLFGIKNLRIAYPYGQSRQKIDWAVDDVSFNLNRGEKLGLIGESGCGKSTIGRGIMRLLPPTSLIEGQIEYKKQSVFDFNPTQMRQFRGEVVALVFQDPMTRLDPLMTIGEHCIETLKSHQPKLSRRQAKEKALEVLEKVKIPASRWGQYPHEFSGGMRQRVAIALALLLNPKAIVADEPTTSLDVTVASEILQELTRLCDENEMALLLISHDLAMVGEYCDRISVMYRGKIVETGSVKSIFFSPQHEYTQSLLKAALHIHVEKEALGTRHEALGKRERRGKESRLEVQEFTNQELEEDISLNTCTEEQLIPILRVENLEQHFTLEGNFLEQWFSKEKKVIKAVDNINFALERGEILGLVGESGCGKSTLSRTILQLIRPTGGKVEFLGENIAQLSPGQMRQKRRQMQMVFQDPHACLNPLMTIGESIADPLFIHQLANSAEAKAKVEKMLKRVGLTPIEDYYHRYPSDLSGGQQQRVAIARALITHPQLVICDEPVSMLDASVQTQVLDLMLELKEEFNLTYLFITHDLWVARFFCDRIAVMNAGKIVELDKTERIFTNPQHPYTQKLLSSAPMLNKLGDK